MKYIKIRTKNIQEEQEFENIQKSYMEDGFLYIDYLDEKFDKLKYSDSELIAELEIKWLLPDVKIYLDTYNTPCEEGIQLYSKVEYKDELIYQSDKIEGGFIFLAAYDMDALEKEDRLPSGILKSGTGKIRAIKQLLDLHQKIVLESKNNGLKLRNENEPSFLLDYSDREEESNLEGAVEYLENLPYSNRFNINMTIDISDFKPGVYTEGETFEIYQICGFSRNILNKMTVRVGHDKYSTVDNIKTISNRMNELDLPITYYSPYNYGNETIKEEELLLMLPNN